MMNSEAVVSMMMTGSDFVNLLVRIVIFLRTANQCSDVVTRHFSVYLKENGRALIFPKGFNWANVIRFSSISECNNFIKDIYDNLESE
ncbi:hypothetical protein Fmac_017840 [Flemingia macrophylla]|uniref:Uncharacterized protein n=1 Tax=Flemingia macrophylla TaxID=520843 RepID=A0ABD1M379_9FABA